ncbi:hypothetical protein SAMN05444141_104200 [Pseudovibrio denitrificans]|uniref:Uncharacterized protein n=1 Tax=Pseudovibrio denitrificans TaxID=258256 RepID=A0A1I7BQK1_9HYPH|nr:hypothetical protein [Pseudovibrio denitrificans]SFT89444.1 hypothetical protein SAMN05444141_104200 [Pseudovibrio denitrificans]
MHRYLIIILSVLLVGIWNAQAQESKFRKRPRSLFKQPDCYCTNRGKRIELGDFSCLYVDGTSYLAQCQMALNNPMWRKIQDGCPTTRLETKQQTSESLLKAESN